MGARHQKPAPVMLGRWWEGTTWNVEVWGVDVKAGGHRGVLLVLHLPVLWRELGELQDLRWEPPPCPVCAEWVG